MWFKTQTSSLAKAKHDNQLKAIQVAFKERVTDTFNSSNQSKLFINWFFEKTQRLTTLVPNTALPRQVRTVERPSYVQRPCGPLTNPAPLC